MQFSKNPKMIEYAEAEYLKAFNRMLKVFSPKQKTKHNWKASI